MGDKCYLCGAIEDTRPYGIGGKPICKDCVNSDPKLEQEALRQMVARVKMAEAADPDGVVMLSDEAPPVPFTPQGDA